MILVFDIGNTNIKTAIFKDNSLIKTWRISTDLKRTGDEYFSILRSLFYDVKIEFSSISKTVISSVVPALIGPFVIVSTSITGKKPLIIGKEIFQKLPLKVPESAVSEIGSDLYCDAFESWCHFNSPVITVDFGTALSFVAISKKGEICGVAITPGIKTAFSSLFQNTAQIPAIPLDIPKSSLGKTTAEAVQSGIILGYQNLVEGLLSQMKNDLSKETGCNVNEIKIVATGGLNSMLSPITNVFDYIDKDLTLKGIFRIANEINSQ